MIIPDDKNIALKNIGGLSGIVVVVYAIAYILQTLDLSFFAICLVCVGLSIVTLFVIGRFLSTQDSHLYNHWLIKFVKYLVLVTVVLICGHLVLFRNSSLSLESASSSSAPAIGSFGNTKQCLQSLSNGHWFEQNCEATPVNPNSHAIPVVSANDPYTQTTAFCQRHEWKWTLARDSPDMKYCPINKMSSKQAQQLFQNKKVLFLGDSILRATYHSFIGQIDTNYTQKYDFSLKHTALSYYSPKQNTSVEFHWTPFVANITSDLSNTKTSYNYIIMSSVFWDALYFHNLGKYYNDFNKLMNLFESWNKANVNSQAVRVWLMPTNVLDERLATEEKRKFMTQQQINVYRNWIYKNVAERHQNTTNSQMLLLHNILDGESVSRLREQSSVDGVHFSEDIYQVIGQMLFNNYYLHFPKLFTKASAVKKPYVPRVTGAMSFPGLGAGMLVLAMVMLFTMDSFFGFGFISLLVFGRSYDWEAGYGALHRKIQASNNPAPAKETRANPDDQAIELAPLVVSHKSEENMA
jgi:hypothetical protein